MSGIVFIPGLLSDAQAFEALGGRLGLPSEVMICAGRDRFGEIVAEAAGKLPEGAIVCGHSMGAYVALNIALSHPEKVAGLILLSATADADTPEAAAMRGKTAAWARVNGLEALVDAQCKVLPAEANREDEALRAALLSMADSVGLNNFCLHQAALAERPDRMGDLASLICPVLVMTGAEDTVTPPDRGRAMADALPNARFQEIAGSGHLLPLEAPQVCAEQIAAFVNGPERTERVA